MTYKILIDDDEIANLRLLERLFRTSYKVLTALSAEEGLEILKQHDVALIISDQRMPGMTGMEFLKQAAILRPHTVRIILTGYSDINALVDAVNSGVVYKYVAKPWFNQELQQTVKRGIENYESNKRIHHLASNNNRLSVYIQHTRDTLDMLISHGAEVDDSCTTICAQRTSYYMAAVESLLSDLDQEVFEPISIEPVGSHTDFGHPSTDFS